MKLAAISEARYAGDFSLEEVTRNYVAAANRHSVIAKRPSDDVEDAHARVVRRDNQTAAAFTVVMRRRGLNQGALIRKFKNFLEHENLPFSYIGVLQSDSPDRIYLEAIYKPRRVFEAKYAFTNHADEVRQAIEADKDTTVKFNIDDFDQIVSQIIKTFNRDDSLQAIEETSRQEGAGLRRTVFHYYPPNSEDRWTISVGAYYPSGRAFVRATKYRNPVFEAAYDSGKRIPRELKRRIADTHRPALRRGVQHPTNVVRIPLHNWLDDNEEYIEELYQEIKSVFERVAREGGDPQQWVHRNSQATWDVWHKFTPSLRRYLHEPSSTSMYHTYHRQLQDLTEIMYEYLLED